MISSFSAAISTIGSPVHRIGDGRWSYYEGADLCASFGHIDGDELTAIAATGSWIAVGQVRLHNRTEVRSWSHGVEGDSDLALVLAALNARGTRCIHALLGDFAFVAWNASTRQVVAARDAFGVKPLYYQQRHHHTAFASHAALLSRNADYDLGYIADFVLNGFDREHRSPYAGVCALAPGHLLVADRDNLRLQRFWAVQDFQPSGKAPIDESCHRFRELLDRGIALAIDDRSDVWSQLSGGLDSSSIVCIADSLWRSGRIANGLAGTVTIADSFDDESVFAQTVAEQCALRHEIVRDYWLWQSDRSSPPETDYPDPLYPFYARNRRLRDVVMSAGGRVLLSGLGPDHFLSGNLYFFADGLRHGRLFDTARELVRWSTLGKAPLWRFAFENAIEPLLPRSVRGLTSARWAAVPDWIPRPLARRLHLADRTQWKNSFDSMHGDRYARAIASTMAHVPACIDRGVFEDGIEMRYPFLYRPLVEFCLQLPRELRTRPFERKWILRESLRPILPAAVAKRRGKGGINSRLVWSLERERAVVDRLAQAPILAQLGVVDPPRLSRAVARAVEGDEQILAGVIRTLALEHWLEVIEGRRNERGTFAELADLTLVPAT